MDNLIDKEIFWEKISHFVLLEKLPLSINDAFGKAIGIKRVSPHQFVIDNKFEIFFKRNLSVYTTNYFGTKINYFGIISDRYFIYDILNISAYSSPWTYIDFGDC